MAGAPSLPPRSRDHGPVAGAVEQPCASREAAPLLDGYQICSLIGQGGMGTVWRAFQLSTRREVALKLLPAGTAASDRARRRFDREVELTSRLQHPHIARVYDSGLHQGIYFYAMELVEGVPLDQYVADHHLNRRAILKLMQLVCLAVQHAHQRGVIHRDLKPSNLLVDRDGAPRVLDFGLAKLLEPYPAATGTAGAMTLSVPGELAGTPAYMSPEQAAGRVAELDTRTDVYSLGVILYRLLTGRSPHDLSGAPGEVLRRIAQHEILRPRSVAAIDRDLDAMLLKALAHDPDDRYLSAGELARDIAHYLGGLPLQARPPTLGYLIRKRLNRHRPLVALLATTSIVLLVVVGYSWYRVSDERDSARASAENERRTRLDAELLLGDALVAGADASAQGGRWEEARARCVEAWPYYERQGLYPSAAAVLISQSYRHSPPPVVTWREPSHPLVYCDFDSSGRVRTVTADGTLRSREMPIGVQSQHGLEHEGEVTRVATSGGDPHQMVFAVTLRSGAAGTVPVHRLLVRDVVSTSGNDRFFPLPGHVNTDVVLTRDGRYAVLGCRLAPDQMDRLRDQEAEQVQRVLLRCDLESTGDWIPFPGSGRAEEVALGPSGQCVVAAEAGPRLRLFDIGSGKPVRTIDCASEWPGGAVSSMASSPDGRLALLGGDGGTLLLIDLQRGVVVQSLRGHTSPPRSLAFDASAAQALSGDALGNVLLWDLSSGRCLRRLEGHRAEVRGVAFSKTAPIAATAGVDGTVNLWSLKEVATHKTLEPGDTGIRAATWSADGREVLIGYADGSVGILDSFTGTEKRRLRAVSASGPRRAVTALAHLGAQAVAVDSAGTVTTWQLPAGTQVGSVSMDAAEDASVAIGTDGRTILCTGQTGASVWDAQTGSCLHQLDNVPISVAALSPGARVACAADHGGAMKFFDLNRAGALATVVRADASSAAFSVSGTRALIGQNDGSIILVDVAVGRELRRIPGHGGPVRSVAFASGDRFAFTCGPEGTVRTWDLQSGRAATTLLTEPSTKAAALQVSAGGRCALTLTEDGRLLIWNFERFSRPQTRLSEMQSAQSALLNGYLAAREAVLLGEWFALHGIDDWAQTVAKSVQQPTQLPGGK